MFQFNNYNDKDWYQSLLDKRSISNILYIWNQFKLLWFTCFLKWNAIFREKSKVTVKHSSIKGKQKQTKNNKSKTKITYAFTNLLSSLLKFLLPFFWWLQILFLRAAAYFPCCLSGLSFWRLQIYSSICCPIRIVTWWITANKSKLWISK